jgi:hypothetical protein
MEPAGRRDGDPYRGNRTTTVGDGVSPSRRLKTLFDFLCPLRRTFSYETKNIHL